MEKDFTQQLNELIASFPTIPFLFVGSGISRRYYNLPNWETLLKHFSSLIGNNDLKFSQYINKTGGDFPKIGTLLEQEFNEWWFENPNNFKLSDKSMSCILSGGSPFKCAISEYLKSNSITVPKYAEEIKKFTEISSKHIAGFITTNYDDFIEKHSDSYKLYSNQDELLFSPLQNIGEIYKIHGTLDDPPSIIITERDYNIFTSKSKYLTAKLLTIFVEYPIIFLGYSLRDPNMQQIISNICDCLTEDKLNTLSNRFFIVERTKDNEKDNISIASTVIDQKVLPFTRIALSDFGNLYTALKGKKLSLPVKILRFFKNEFYTYVLTNTPSSQLKVAYIDDKNIRNEDLVMAIAAPDAFGKFGLTGIDGPQWYSNYLLKNIKYSADDLLEFAYPVVIKSNQKLPIYKYLKEAKKEHPQVEPNTPVFNNLFNTTILKRRNKLSEKSLSFANLLGSTLHHHLNYIIDNITEDNVNLNELEEFLLSTLNKNPNILTEKSISTEFKRLIRIYDWLKYK